MNIIKTLSLLWKVWRKALSIEEFLQLVNLAETSLFAKEKTKNKVAEWLLKLYFARHILNEDERKILCNQQYFRVQEMWLNVAKKKKKLDDQDERMLVEYMPWYSIRNFPQQLSRFYLMLMFSERNPLKIVAYCRDYILPADFEKLLIEQYQRSLTIPDKSMLYRKFFHEIVNGWEEALNVYLDALRLNRQNFSLSDFPQKIMELNDENLTKKLLKHCSIADNFLPERSLWYLVEHKNEFALRLFLCESYLPNGLLLKQKIVQEFPKIEAAVNIAQCRREIYLLEQKHNVFLGALSFTPQEYLIIVKQLEKYEDIEEIYIQPLLNTFKPCMCAYVAYHFPHLADRACNVTKTYYDECFQQYKR